MTKQLTMNQKKKLHRKKSRARKMRNVLRLLIVILAVGIFILAGLVVVEFFGKRASTTTVEGANLNQTRNNQSESKDIAEQVDLTDFDFSEEEMSALKDKEIVIDAGHGGTDSGTIGPKTGVYESKLNMQVASRMEKVLTAFGIKVIMTRENTGTQEMPSDKGLTWEQRGSIIKNAKADLLLSIHHNYNETSAKIHGVQVLFRESGTKDFAVALQEKYNQELQIQMDYLQDEYRVLSYGKQPGVIIECGFFSNKEEEKKLQTAEYQNWLVKTTVEAVAEYFTKNP